MSQQVGARPAEAGWEDKLRVFADSTAAYMAYVSADDLVYRFVNRAFEVGYGRPREQIVGHHIRDIIGPKNYEFALPFIERVRAGETVSYENSFSLVQGRRWVRVNYQPDLRPDGTVAGIFVLTYDISAGREAEEETRRQKELAEQLVDTAQVMVLVIDPTGHILRWNRTMEAVTGYARDEVLGRDGFEILYDEADRPRVRDSVQRALAGIGPQGVRSAIKRRDGTRRTVEWNTGPLRDSEGMVVGLLVTGQDLTERLKQEEEHARLEQQLLQAQKLEAIGKLAGGVAHDINNILGAILGFASVLDRFGGSTPAVRQSVAGIHDAANRGAELTRNLLGFARKGNYRKERVDLNALARQTEALLSRTVPKEVALKQDLALDLPAVEGDPNQLGQALVNLILNAVDAISGRGTVTVSTARTAAGRVLLEVRDDGVGMDEATRQRAFEPFFTTKPVGAGTGLGLSMVYGTVQNHGGDVRLESTPGVGTRVVIELPAARVALPAPPQRPATPPAGSVQRSGAVLLVDDEALVRNSSARMLEMLGYEVVLAEDGRAALDRFNESRGRIRAVVLDLLMPVMNGEETFRQLRQLDPSVPILLATGHNSEKATADLASGRHVALLQKPFDLAALAGALDRLTAPR